MNEREPIESMYRQKKHSFLGQSIRDHLWLSLYIAAQIIFIPILLLYHVQWKIALLIEAILTICLIYGYVYKWSR
jgi:Ca2+/Na+ antiporter